MPQSSALSQKPLKLLSNRVWRTYYGGKLIEAWQGIESPQDNSFPEEWIASVVQARNAGREDKVEGLSWVEVDGEAPISLKELVERGLYYFRRTSCPSVRRPIGCTCQSSGFI